MQYSVLLSALYASMALAITVTSPDNTTTWSDSGSNTIKWTSVNTDPSMVNIVLVNNAVFPNTQTTIASNVQTSLGSYTVKSLTGTGGGFQVNLIESTNNEILAQSKQFTLTNTSPASGGGSSVSSASMSLSTSTSTISSTSTSAASSSTSLTSMSTSGTSTMSTASTASTGSTASTASTGSTMSTATASGTPTGSAGAGSTSGTASSTAASSTSSSGATMNAISFVGLGLTGLLALLA